MTSAERFELFCAPLAAAAAWLAWPALPHRVAVGWLLLAASALLLLQSLLRDLWLLRAGRGRAAEQRTASAMCIESLVGMAGVVAGALASLAAATTTVELSRLAFALGVFAVVVAGFLLKDWVVERRPWRLRREPDHLNLIVRW